MHKRLITVLAVASLLLCGSGAAVYALPETSVTNHFETGVVDINLKEYMVTEEGKEIAWENSGEILPGMQISKIPRITNDGNDCYVRAGLSFDTDEITDSDIYGFGEDWIRADDGYYYYKNILKTGESVDLFQGLNIPDDLSQEKLEGKSFSIQIDADAIQSANFTPDFESEAPWGQVEIVECEKEGQYDITSFKQIDNAALQIEYQGDVKALIAAPDDFFNNLPYFMPGDTYSDNAAMINNSGSDIRIYFRNEILTDDEILKKIQLTITSETNGQERTVYSGDLRGEGITGSTYIGTIPAGQDGNFRFTIAVPSELNNDYSLLSSYVKWVFSTEEIPEPSEPIIPIKTGDGNTMGLALIACGMSAGAIAIILYFRKRHSSEVALTNRKEAEK